MSYIIYKSNGLQLLTLLDGTLDTSTGLNLVGKNYINYGTVQNENFVWLLENQASDIPPPYPLIGQLWYDTSKSSLKYYDGIVFHAIASTGTSSLTLGDLQATLQSNVAQLYSGLTANVISLAGSITAANTAMKLYVDSNAAVQSAQIVAANLAISDLQSSIGSFYTYANTAYGSSNYTNATAASYLPTSSIIIGINANITAANAATVLANTAMQHYVSDLNTVQTNKVTGANATISALSSSVSSFYTYANATYGTSNYSNTDVAAYLPTAPVITGIGNRIGNVEYSVTDLNASLTTYINNKVTGANTRIQTLDANVGSFYTYANATYGYSNVTLAAALRSLTSNVATTANIIATGNVYSNGNIAMVSNLPRNVYVSNVAPVSGQGSVGDIWYQTF
jgi:hypothetical protein